MKHSNPITGRRAAVRAGSGTQVRFRRIVALALMASAAVTAGSASTAWAGEEGLDVVLSRFMNSASLLSQNAVANSAVEKTAKGAFDQAVKAVKRAKSAADRGIANSRALLAAAEYVNAVRQRNTAFRVEAENAVVDLQTMRSLMVSDRAAAGALMVPGSPLNRMVTHSLKVAEMLADKDVAAAADVVQLAEMSVPPTDPDGAEGDPLADVDEAIDSLTRAVVLAHMLERKLDHEKGKIRVAARLVRIRLATAAISSTNDGTIAGGQKATFKNINDVGAFTSRAVRGDKGQVRARNAGNAADVKARAQLVSRRINQGRD